MTAWLPSMVTVPLAPEKAAYLPFQWLARLPLASVQLLPAAFQVPLPPAITPSGVVLAPFQNRISPGWLCSTRLTWFGWFCRVRLALV
ncbi:Uncharacterised protein [Achromobacter sp. 2789STDY5608615]|nr:Uncharacterised protein [Achromobacter sp. 2789STDY5608615]